MKSFEFITEADQNIDIDGIVSQIKRNCQPFLTQTNRPMFRGMNKNINRNVFAMVNTLAERFPRDTPTIIHDNIVAWFDKQTGIPFRKSHTVFTTGSRYSSTGYGESFMVFPIGTFDYCWSPLYEDLTDQFSYMQNKNYLGNEIQQQVAATMNKGNYQINKGLDSAINSFNEIMIHCRSYYILNHFELFRSEGLFGDVEELYNQLFFG